MTPTDDVPPRPDLGPNAEILELLRGYQRQFDENIRHLAAWMSLPTSDATALGEIMWADQSQQPMSPARLSERIGMTSGATTALINRLESAGHIVRSRESDDRRIVTLRPTDPTRTRAQEFFEGPSGALHAAFDALGRSELTQCIGVLEVVVSTMAVGNRRLREHGVEPRDR